MELTLKEQLQLQADNLYAELTATEEILYKLAALKNKDIARCSECGKPLSECDPDGVGHYRG